MEVKEVLKDMDRRMHGAIEVLHGEFKQLRTGRASTSMLERSPSGRRTKLAPSLDD